MPKKSPNKLKTILLFLVFSLIFLTCFSPLIFPSINSKLILKEVNASSSNYFGDGNDGDVTISSDTNLAAVEDGNIVLKQYTSLTINEGKTLTTDNRCKGLFIYVTGDVTINGTLTMTARGGKVDPVAAGVSATGIRLPMLKSGEADTLSAADFAGCGSNLISAVTNQSGISGNGKIFTITRAGANGGAAVVSAYPPVDGNAGTAGSTGQLGGGGSGGASAGTGGYNCTSGAGTAGTCFSGGTAGGGCAASGTLTATNGVANGGSGGAGNQNHSDYEAGGGSGNPGGAGSGGGVAGTSGTGGLLILIVGGDLTIGTAGKMSSNGRDGGGATGSLVSVGGGGSGGGHVLILYAGSLNNDGMIEANGGSGGIPTGNYLADGGNGGAGSVQGPIQIDASGYTVSTPPTDTTIYTSSDWGTDVSSSGQTGTVEVGAVDSTSNKRVATFDLDFSANIDLVSLTIDSNPTAGKAVFHYPGGFSSIPGHTSSGGQSGSYTLYVPKGEGNKVCICPNATCLSEVNATCVGRYCKDETYNNVTVATEGGTEYWKVSGLTGSGGESQEYSGEFTTIATVLNQAPSFTSMAESIASYDSSPTNVGNSVTFSGSALDNNTDDWWLIICKANSAPTHNGTNAPTCNGGTWCTASSAVNTGSSSICSYTVLQQDGGGQQQGNSETENWYAYTCDSVSGGDCSNSSQGTQGDNSVSPFSVNHRPTFTSASVPSVDPGSTFTYTASYIEEDNSPSKDLVNLYVCESSGFTIGTGCTGTKICHSTNITGGNTLSCTDTAPAVHQDGTAIDYYAYMYDGHNLASNPFLKSGTSTTNNVSPTVSGVTLVIPDDSLTLTENSTATESFTITGTITDNNNCHDVLEDGGSAISYFYHASGTATGYSGCDTTAEQDPDSCYPDISCILDPSSNTCSGVKATSTDATLDFLCTVSATIQYYADPTDVDTPWSSDLWYATTKAIDDNSLTGNGETTTGRECDSLTALDISSSIDYLALTAGEQDSKCDVTNLVTATGNVGLDAFLYGTDMSCDTGVTPQCTGAADIDQAKQHHSFVSNTDYTSGTVMQETGTDGPPYTQRELDCQKTYYDSSLQQGQKDTYWGIAIPAIQPSGTYIGTNTIEGAKSESIGTGMWNW